HAVVGGEGQRQGRRPGTGADDRVGHPAPHPLVDEGGGEGGLDVGGSGIERAGHGSDKNPSPWPCTANATAPVPGSCCCTASRRRAAAGARSRLRWPWSARCSASTRRVTAGRPRRRPTCPP